MNWQLQLAAALTAEEGHLLSAAKRARELTEQVRYGAALKILWKLLLTATRHGNHRHRAFLLIHMGRVYRHWMIEVAFKLFRDARDLSRATGFVRGEMVAESSIGELYLDWKEPARAIVHFERCLLLAEVCGGLWWQRDVLVAVVLCLESLGHWDRSRLLRKRLDHLDGELLAELWGEPEGRTPDQAVMR